MIAEKAKEPATRQGATTGDRKIIAIPLFLASFFVVSVSVGYLLDDRGFLRYRDWLSEKLYLLKNADPRTDLVFVGASITLRGVVPEIVDRAAANAGCDFHSINLGFPNAQIYEVANMIDHVLETDLPAGSMIVYDAASLIEELSFREIHMRPRLAVAAKLPYTADIYDVVPDRGDRLVFASNYLLAALSEALGIHLMSDAIIMEPMKFESLDRLRIDARGYLANKDDPTARRDYHERFLTPKVQAEFQRKFERWDLAKFRRKNQQRQYPNPFAERIRNAGFRPVVYAAPWRTPELAIAALNATEADPDLAGLILSKDNLPEIYEDTGHWYDRSHVSKSGAALSSQYIGEELCRIAQNSQ